MANGETNGTLDVAIALFRTVTITIALFARQLGTTTIRIVPQISTGLANVMLTTTFDSVSNEIVSLPISSASFAPIAPTTFLEVSLLATNIANL